MDTKIDIEGETTGRQRRVVKPFRRIKELIAAVNAANAQVQFAEAQLQSMRGDGILISVDLQKEVNQLQQDLDRAVAELHAYKSRGKGKHPPYTRSVLSRRLEDRSIYTPHQSLREKRRRVLRAQRGANQ